MRRSLSLIDRGDEVTLPQDAQKLVGEDERHNGSVGTLHRA